MNLREYGVAVPCNGCLEVFSIYVTEQDYNDWLQGRKHIQDAFPYLSVDERGLLLTRTCGKCWEEMFPEDDDDDWEDEEAFYTAMDLLDPESDDPSYERDWYVD